MSDFSEVLGSLTLSDVCEDVRIEDESGSYFADMGHQIPGRPGVEYDDEADLAPLVLSMRVILKATDASQNLSKIKAELRKPGLVALKRTLSYPANEIRAMVKQVTKPIQSDPVIYTFILTAPSGSWQDVAEDSDSGAPATGVTTTGDTEIHDPRVSLASAGTRTVTTADGLVYTIVAAAGLTYPVVVDVGAGTVIDNNGDGARGDVTFDHQHWFRLSPNHTHTVTGGTATWFWRNRWA